MTPDDDPAHSPLDPLFRGEAVEQRRNGGMGVVVARRSPLASAAALLLLASFAALVLWLSLWHVAPGLSLLGWIAAR
jgi:hypothetical protein